MKIPQAADGSVFTADLVLPDGSYRIGPKGAERNIQGYQEALAVLCAMPVPRWRRPNSTTGMRGIVSAVGWVSA